MLCISISTYFLSYLSLYKDNKRTFEKMKDFCFTLNNYDNYAAKKLKTYFEKNKNITYICWGREVGEEGTPHLQGYVQCKILPPCFKKWNETVFGKKVDNKKVNYANCEKCYVKASAEQSAGYCFKGEAKSKQGETPGNEVYFSDHHKTWKGWEAGEFQSKVKQGQRTDVDEIRTMVIAGELTYDDWFETAPTRTIQQFGNVIKQAEDLYLKRLSRMRIRGGKCTEGIWIIAKGGVGKDHAIWEQWSDSLYYWVDNGGVDWQDNYRGQKTVVISEMRDTFNFDFLKTMVDKWDNCDVQRRGRAAIKFTSERVVITSTKSPEEVFAAQAASEDWGQFTRRFTLVDWRHKERHASALTAINSYVHLGDLSELDSLV